MKRNSNATPNDSEPSTVTPPGRSGYHGLREVVIAQGFDPGDAATSNSDPDLVRTVPGTAVPGGVPAPTDSAGYDHPVRDAGLEIAGKPAVPKHSPRTTGGAK
jgi:hypothetical protein